MAREGDGDGDRQLPGQNMGLWVELARSAPRLGRAGPWAAGDWPCCCGVTGADGPRVLIWGLGCGQGERSLELGRDRLVLGAISDHSRQRIRSVSDGVRGE